MKSIIKNISKKKKKFLAKEISKRKKNQLILCLCEWRGPWCRECKYQLYLAVLSLPYVLADWGSVGIGRRGSAGGA